MPVWYDGLMNFRRCAMLNLNRKSGLLLVALPAVLGLLLRLLLPSFRFTGWILLGVSVLLLLFGLIRLLRKRHPRAAKVLFSLLCVGLSMGILAAVITGIPIAGAATAVPGACDYVIVLGAGINGSTPSLSLRDRLDAAYDYLTAYPDALCVVSGGQGPGEDMTEALCMFNDLTARGIDPKRIWMEDKSTSTRENIAFSLALIEEKTGQRPREAGVLSSEYHMYRAKLVAREQGLEAIEIPARTSWISLRINYFLREIVAVWYYVLLGG